VADKVSLALVIHSHQPVGNFDHVIEEAYRKAYRPFVEALIAHPSIRLSLHYSGILFEWLEAHHPEFFDFLRLLVERHQVEIVGGGFYEPILVAISDADKLAQIQKLSGFIESRFGARPGGAWLAERVWEPSLARPLAAAGVDYLVLDDTHFIAAGLEASELHGVYMTEETGAALRLVPSLKALRYAIPFRGPEETLGILREGEARASRLFAMGDDCEKFGVWPGTYEHCYKNGWLERFLTGIENASTWLETTTVSGYLATHAPVGRVYLPTASYEEMMEWALPAPVSRELKLAREETERSPSGARQRRFLRGGIWQNFFAKYPESNLIHKLMLKVSRRLEIARPNPSAGGAKNHAPILREAETHLLAAQCNDAYWHGVFGGIYAPHLRSALLRHLIQAEVLLDRLEPAAKAIRIETRDFDADGREEVLIENPTFGMVIRPADGGTVSSLRFKPSDVELVNSMMRRYEAYHDQVRERVSSGQPVSRPAEGPASIHERVLSKEANLSALLRYDRYARQAFRVYLFPAIKGLDDFDYLGLGENPELAGGPWSLVAPPETKRGTVSLEKTLRMGSGELRFEKTIRTEARQDVWKLECDTEVSSEQTLGEFAVGLELVLNLLAPDSPDRYFKANGQRHPLEFKGEISAGELRVTDQWQKVECILTADRAPRWWIVPIETISQSESGFERVYQGSAIMAVWRPPAAALDFRPKLTMMTRRTA
jgi:4-alpha-glucanotransferase